MRNPKTLRDEVDPKDEGRRIRRLREQLRLSQAGLAEGAGTTQQTVDRIEKGEVRHSRSKSRIIEVLEGVALSRKNDGGFSDALEAMLSELIGPSPSHSVEEPIPVFLSRKMTPDGQFRSPIDYLRRPENLLAVTDAYALLVTTGEMEPIIKTGDFVFVHPALPARLNDEVVFRREPTNDNGEECRMGTLLGMEAAVWRARQWTPLQDETYARDTWQACHVVVGKMIPQR